MAKQSVMRTYHRIPLRIKGNKLSTQGTTWIYLQGIMPNDEVNSKRFPTVEFHLNI